MDIVPLWGEESTMPKSRPGYPPEFRQRSIALMRKGRTPESLAEQFELPARTIRYWLAQPAWALERGRGSSGAGGRPVSGVRRAKRVRRGHGQGSVLLFDREDFTRGVRGRARRSTSHLPLPEMRAESDR